MQGRDKSFTAGTLAQKKVIVELDPETDEGARARQDWQDAQDEVEKFASGTYRAVTKPGRRVDGWDV